MNTVLARAPEDEEKTTQPLIKNSPQISNDISQSTHLIFFFLSDSRQFSVAHPKQTAE